MLQRGLGRGHDELRGGVSQQLSGQRRRGTLLPASPPPPEGPAVPPRLKLLPARADPPTPPSFSVFYKHSLMQLRVVLVVELSHSRKLLQAQVKNTKMCSGLPQSHIRLLALHLTLCQNYSIECFLMTVLTVRLLVEGVLLVSACR